MRAAHFGALLAVTLLAGCSSHPEIPVSDQQSLVMESNVLAAGISAEVPTVTASEIQATATTRLFNERFITKGKNPLPFIIVFTGMTPEGWKCIRWSPRAA